MPEAFPTSSVSPPPGIAPHTHRYGTPIPPAQAMAHDPRDLVGLQRPKLSLRVFGPIEITGVDGAESLLVQPKRVALLVYLVLSRPRGFHRRDRLVTLFWPEHSSEGARAALRKAAYAIRQVLGEDVLI